MDITEAARVLEQFCGQDLTGTLAEIEKRSKDLTWKN